MPKTAADLRREAQRLLAEADQIDTARQYTEADLKTMTPHQIEAARLAGQLDDLMNGDEAA